MIIRIENLYCFPNGSQTSDEILERKLNELNATRIISIENMGEYDFKVIYEL